MDVSKLIDERIRKLNDWRGERLVALRKLIHSVSPEIGEDWKWGSPIFTYHGMICSLGSFQDHVKVHFFQGASLSDPHRAFNAGLEAKGTRGIDLFERDPIPDMALKQLIAAAMDLNGQKNKD